MRVWERKIRSFLLDELKSLHPRRLGLRWEGVGKAHSYLEGLPQFSTGCSRFRENPVLKWKIPPARNAPQSWENQDSWSLSAEQA